MKKIGLKRYVRVFSVDSDIIDTNNILDIHKHLMEENIMQNKIMFGFIKKMFIELLSFCTIVRPIKRPIKLVFLNNRPRQTRPILVDINSLLKVLLSIYGQF